MPANILVADDDESIRTAVGEYLGALGYAVRAVGDVRAAQQTLLTELPEAAVVDYHMPDGNALGLLEWMRLAGIATPVIILTGHGTIDLAVRAVKAGAEYFLVKPVELSALASLLEKAIATHSLRTREMAFRVQRARRDRNPFLGGSAGIRALHDLATRVARTDTPVLIQGETGTGKGVLAAWLRQHGSRAEQPFVDVNCAGLSTELMESEVFGHEKGAFTGAAASKSGLIEIAQRGTLFLDEIGDTHPTVQAKLLKVVEEKRFRRLGDVRERTADVRLIAATHHDLARMVDAGQFRADLFFRINQMQLRIPALRERPADIPVIAEHLLSALGTEIGRDLQLAPDALNALLAYRWPGNIRELRNLLERAAIVCPRETIMAADLQFDFGAAAAAADLTLEEVERQRIREALVATGGNVTAAAATLGVPRSTLYAKLKRTRAAAR